MALEHAKPGQVIDISPVGARLRQEISVALFKSADIEVMRLVLLAGQEMPAHRVHGEITLQCLEGTVDVTADGTRHTLKPQTLLYLEGRSEHALKAVEDAAVLVTVVVRPQAAG